ncbi:integrin beta-PS-like [Daphnia carinata]|uniref:integrin beta-PS-like n=1 Tax=Daphnia carinata TaxID=120202 RepID=UPI00257E45F9|nr:integrin beta-PS-like [Daphnia carinata]
MYFPDWKFWTVFCVLFAYNTYVQGNAHDPCLSATTCVACIRVPNCVWCSHKTTSLQGNKSHQCQLRDLMTYCPPESLVDPIPVQNILVVKQDELIQLHPQRVSVTNLRQGLVHNFSMQFEVVKNYPADLYYLMDVSHSMLDDKNNLMRLAPSLVETMRNITPAFQFGFGSFVNKNVIPFVEKTTASCDPRSHPEIGCPVTYSFRHQLSMSADVNKFTETVNSTSIVSTFDVPEGGFDALLQAMVCKDRIGWREKSRRLIVFATDAHSHLAGNGRLGGIIQPNDGLCHLDPDNTYIEALNQDYPSLGQISRFAKDNDINIIFAVTNDVKSSYQEFSKFVPGSSVANLDPDSENIVELVRETYEKISLSVEMIDTSGPEVRVRYYTACTGTLVQENNKCEGLKVGDIVNFTISIEAIECPANVSARTPIIQIKPVGVNEVLTLDLEIVCDCACEKPGGPGFVANATECNSSGDLKCGVCECDSSHSGSHCECRGNENIVELETKCKPDNATKILCSGRGDCFCGKCQCHKRPNSMEEISGTYCECDDFSCDRFDGNLCAGHGSCNCGQCLCNAGWQGSDCNCKTTNETCIPIGGGDVCSGNGVCNCGSCQCSATSNGRYCENCPTCPSRCDEFTPCVQCKVFQTGPYSADNEAVCNSECTYSIETQETVQVEETSERECSYENEQKCTINFVYGFDSNGARQVRVQQEPICPPPIPVLAVGFGLAGALIALLLLALISYRIVTYIYDKREYARVLKERECEQFEDETQNVKWNAGNNPLYVNPWVT